MGAYYAACLRYPEKKSWKMYAPWQCDNGVKLLEHSYVGNNYINEVTKLISYRPAYLAWLCDYHSKEDEKDLYWYHVKDDKTWEPAERKEEPYYALYINLTKKEFFDTKELISRITSMIDNFDFKYVNTYIMYSYDDGSKNEEILFAVFHPLPFLTNSENEYAGGGDYEEDIHFRKRWYKDLIVAVSPSYNELLTRIGFRNITSEVMVPGIESYSFENIEEFKRFALITKYLKKFNCNSPGQAFLADLSMRSLPESDREINLILEKYAHLTFPEKQAERLYQLSLF